ncbi:hypothetical protein BH09ACT6_BH09ACT6_07350 [soil metagenome]
MSDFSRLMADDPNSPSSIASASGAAVDGELLTPRQRAAKRRKRRIIAGVAVTAVLCVSGGGVAYALTRPAGPNYRTSVATMASVSETLAVSGSIASATRHDEAFSVGGTVDTVAVSVGDTVTAGQQLATLGTADLQAAIDSAQTAVTKAEQTLTDDLDSQTATTTASTSTASTSTGSTSLSSTASTAATSAAGATSGSTSTAAADPAVTAATTAVTDAQQKLLAQYAAAQTALATDQTLLDASTATCKPFLEATTADTAASGASLGDGTAHDGTAGDGTAGDGAADDSTASATPTNTPAPTPSLTPTPTPTSTPTAGTDGTSLEHAQALLADCQSAIVAVAAGQTTANTAQASVLTLVDTLDTAITALQKAMAATSSTAGSASGSAAAGTAASGTAADTTASTGAVGSTGTSMAAGMTASTGTGASTSTTPASAETIVADRAQIDVANQALTVSEKNLALATLTSATGGTVAAVSLAVGDTVSAGSTTAVITVIGTDGYVVDTTVSLANIPKVAVGQTATATLPSTGATLTGTVSRIGVLNVSTTSTPSYAVTIAFDNSVTVLNGASAQIEIQVSNGDSVLTIPTSAVHRSGATYTADLLIDGSSVSTVVTVGAIGTERTQVLTGVNEGDTIVLADLDTDVTSDSTTSTSTGLTGLGGSSTQTGPQGGFGGAPPAGFTGP